MFEKVANKVKVTSPFLPRCLQFCPYLVQSLLTVTARADVDSLVQDEIVGELVVEAIETVVLFAGEQEFQEELIRTFRSLIVGVGLNLMRTGASEL